MDVIFLISIYSVLLVLLFTVIFIRVREEIIALRNKYHAIIGIAPERRPPAKKAPKKEAYDRPLQDMLDERKKAKSYMSGSIAA
jgi:hypothetical protein